MFSSFVAGAVTAYQENEFSGQLNDFHISNGIQAKVSRKPPPIRERKEIRTEGGRGAVYIYIYI